MHEVRHMTYYAHLVISTPNLPETVIDLDCRPSDCVNVCLRAGVPFYVLGKLAQQMAKYQHEPPLSQAQQHKIKASCMQEQRWHQDPFLMMRLQMQLYISSGLYADAERSGSSFKQLALLSPTLTMMWLDRCFKHIQACLAWMSK